MNIDAVLFDADGVIQGPTEGWGDRLAARLGVDSLAILAEVFEAERPTLTGAGNFRDAVAAVLDRWHRLDHLDAVLASWHEIEVDSAALTLIGELRGAGVRCCLATNQQDLRTAYMRRELRYDRHFDEQFYSCELGVAKPDEGYFTSILQFLELTPDRVLFIDDHPENVEAAGNVGLHSAVFRRQQGVGELAALLAAYGLRAGSPRRPAQNAGP